MSYQKGDLKRVLPQCDGEYCYCFPEIHYVNDSRADSTTADLPAETVYLPHSCNEWVVGGQENLEALITDLQTVLATLK